MVEANLGPALKGVSAGFTLGAIQELQPGDHGFPFLHIGFLELKDVNHAQVNAANLIGVVVEERDGVVGVGGVDPEFLANLALHAGVVGGAVQREKPLVLVVHVTAYSNRPLGDKSLFARLFPPHVVKDTALVDKERVRDDLFEGGIRFSRRARGEEILAPVEQLRQVAIDLKVESLEGAELIEMRAADYVDHFVFHGPGIF